MTTSRAWAVITLGEERQYGGNLGYQDDLRRIYRFDSNVGNHLGLAAGDLILLRNRTRLLGIARIDRIMSQPGHKTMNRCPVCGVTDLKPRRRKLPRFRCSKGHEFAEPIAERADVTLFDAYYENHFVDALGAVPLAQIKQAAKRPSDQMSIEEIDLARLEEALLANVQGAAAILDPFFQSSILTEGDAAEDPSPESPTVDAPDSANSPYVLSMADTRAKVLRAIRERRGQRRFRNALMRRYGGRCTMTGCELADVLEAAHIWPLRDVKDHNPSNGLLLRADLHTLLICT